MNAIEIRELTKRYGNVKALDNLDLNVPQGQVFGFLGPNGAGKTTTTRMLAGLAYPTSGSIIILGHDIVKDNASVKRLMGYLPDVPAFYGWMRAREYLAFIGGLFELSGPELKRRIDSLLDAAGLSDNNQPIETFSRGMKQRLGIAQAFINDPAILLMDEPTSALDPIGRKEVLDMIKSLSEEKTVFFSTHILADAERVCDSIAIIDRGQLITQGSLQELKDKYTKPVFTVEVDANAELLANKLRSIPWITSIVTDRNTVSINVSDMRTAQVEIAGIIADSGLPLRRLDLKETTLEDIFVDLVKRESR